LRTTTPGATTASLFSNAVGTPKLAVRVGAAAIPGTNSAGGKPRPLEKADGPTRDNVQFALHVRGAYFLGLRVLLSRFG
jgi:hypothetical protein